MVELCDTFEANAFLHSANLLKHSVEMISSNIFRTFANKSKTLSYSEIQENRKGSKDAEPDEDEPHLEESWPHLQLVYELLLKLIMSESFDSAAICRHLNHSFVKRYLELFDSEDSRERDYVKTILHRIYGKFLEIRSYIKE